MSEYESQGQSEQQIASQRFISVLGSNIRSVTMQHIPVDQIISYMEMPSFTCSVVVQTGNDYWELVAAQVNTGKCTGRKHFIVERLVARADGTQNDERIRYSFDDGAVEVDKLSTFSRKTNGYWSDPAQKIQNPYAIGVAFAPLFSPESKGGLPVLSSHFNVLDEVDARKVLEQHKKIMLADFDDMHPRRSGSTAPGLLGRISLIVWPR